MGKVFTTQYMSSDGTHQRTAWASLDEEGEEMSSLYRIVCAEDCGQTRQIVERATLA